MAMEKPIMSASLEGLRLLSSISSRYNYSLPKGRRSEIKSRTIARDGAHRFSGCAFPIYVGYAVSPHWIRFAA